MSMTKQNKGNGLSKTKKAVIITLVTLAALVVGANLVAFATNSNQKSTGAVKKDSSFTNSGFANAEITVECYDENLEILTEDPTKEKTETVEQTDGIEQE